MATVRRDPESKIFNLWWKEKGQDGRWRARRKSLKTKDPVTAKKICADHNEDQALIKRGYQPIHRAMARQERWWDILKAKMLRHINSTLAKSTRINTTYTLNDFERIVRPGEMTLDEFEAKSAGDDYKEARMLGQPGRVKRKTGASFMRPVSASTINTEIGHLRALFDYAISNWSGEVGLKRNPFPKGMRAGSKTDIQALRALPKCLSLEEVGGVIAEFSRRYGLPGEIMAEFFYYVGARRGEVQSLRIQDVLLSKKLVRLFGKGGKERFVPIPDSFFPKLEAYVAGKEPSAYVFPSNVGTIMPVTTIFKRFKRAFRAIGAPWAHPHTMRHSYITHRLDNGDPLKDVSEDAGHANIATTSIYTHAVKKLRSSNPPVPPRPVLIIQQAGEAAA